MTNLKFDAFMNLFMKNYFAIVFILTLLFLMGCERDEPFIENNYFIAPYIKGLIQPDTLNAYKGDYFIEIVMKNEATSETKNLRFDSENHLLRRLMTYNQGKDLSVRGISMFDTISEESIEISFYSNVDSLFYINYANYYYSSPWAGTPGVNIEYFVPVGDPTNPNSYFRFLGSNSTDSFFDINYIGNNHLNGAFKTKWEECCGNTTTYNIEGDFSIPINDLWGIWQDIYVNGSVKYLGNLDDDDCGWVVDVSSDIYKPINLPDEFKTNNLKVKIKYRILNSSTTCGVSYLLKEINIYDIIKQ